VVGSQAIPKICKEMDIFVICTPQKCSIQNYRFTHPSSTLLITVAARPKAWNVFTRSKAGTVGSNPTQGIDVCLRLFCVCVGNGLVMGWSPIQGALLTVLGLRTWNETKRFTDALCSRGSSRRKRDRVQHYLYNTL
jgi:hypothetical protein